MMPVEVVEKVRAISEDVGGPTALARLLGVSPSRVRRWLRGEEPNAADRRMVDGVEFTLARLMTSMQPSTAVTWLQGTNAHLGNRRPIDRLAAGGIAEVLNAIEAYETGAYA